MQLWRYGRPLEYLGQRYRLDGMLGSGGMADVCLAWDERGQRQVALKILKSDDLDQETLNRFMKEAAQIAHWQHPHILRIYEHLQVELLDASTGAALFYMVSEYARGGDLQKRLTPGRPFPLASTFALFRQLCSAVQYAHERGVIHRDLKPLNMLFRRPASGPEELVLSDFGLAVQVDASHYTFARGGTLAYMAPEQLQGNAQPASDIFALGVILYVLCTGQLPFRRALQDIPRIVQGQMPPPTRPCLLNPELPPALDEIMLRAMRDLPAERYSQPREFWEALELALKTNAHTLPFVAASEQSAGQTWPYDDGSEQPQRNYQAGQQGQPPVASSSLPGEEIAEVKEGSVSALWIAREKQKASPVRLPLPTNSILMSPNPAGDDAPEHSPPNGAAPATWQPADERSLALPTSNFDEDGDMNTEQANQGNTLRRGPEQRQHARGTARVFHPRGSTPFATSPGSGASRAPGESALPSTILEEQSQPGQTSRRRQSGSGEAGSQTSRRQPEASYDSPLASSPMPRRASRQGQPAGASSRRALNQGHVEQQSAAVYDIYGSDEDEAYPDTRASSPGGASRRASAMYRQSAQSSLRTTPAPAILTAQSRGRHFTATSRARRRRAFLALAGGLVLLGLLLALFTATSLQGAVLSLFGAPVTTVTIQPRSHLLTEDAPRVVRLTSGQLAASDIPGRQLTATSPTQSTTANATGSVQGKRATGILTLLNNTPDPITVAPAIITDDNGIQVSWHETVVVPAVPPASITVVGFAVQTGEAGNIPVLDIAKPCCVSGIVIKNTSAFTGGQDAQKNAVIQQKDIDGAAKGLIASEETQAKAALQQQVKSSERAAGEEQCRPQVNSDQKAGALAKTATVQVTVTCTMTVYDYSAARQSFARDLQSRASTDATLGASYALAGQVALTLVSANNTTQGDGSVVTTLQFHAQGLMVYQFPGATLRDLTTQLAGLSQAAARELLLRQPGVLGVQFSASGNLPVNTSEIRLVVQSPPAST